MKTLLWANVTQQLTKDISDCVEVPEYLLHNYDIKSYYGLKMTRLNQTTMSKAERLNLMGQSVMGAAIVVC